jgi:hypothetical protein
MAVLSLLLWFGLLVASVCPAAAMTSADSLGASVEDSLRVVAVDSLKAGASDSLTVASAPLAFAPPLSRTNVAAIEELLRRRSETLDDVVRALPRASLRVDGDRGMRSYLSLNPLDPGWVEMDLDGVPTQNPVDDESALWDLPVLGLSSLSTADDARWSSGGSSRLHLETEPGIEGRTRMRTHFSSTANESFYRAISVRTPDADRSLRLDYGEWKTEEGTRFSRSPNLGGTSDPGRSKLRRFALGADLRTDLGLVSLRYGRGTRFYRGSVSSSETVERWNGRLSLRLLRQTEARRTDIRLYHLDWHIDDDVHRELRDGSRRGLRAQQRPISGIGWFWQAEFEELGGRFESVGDTAASVRGLLHARFAPGYRLAPTSNWSVFLAAEAVHAENSRHDVDFGGRVETELQLTERWQFSSGVRRTLRTPTVLESNGWSGVDTVVPIEGGYDPTVTTWTRRAGVDLSTETQDLLFVRSEGELIGWRWSLGAEHWRLRDGIGWETFSAGDARFRGGLELDRTQLVGSLQTRRDWGNTELHLVVWGHRLLGSLRRDASRGGGWPIYASRTRAGFSRPFFSSHNRWGLDVISRVLGPRFDDRHVVLGASNGDILHELNLETALQIRDAEIRLSYDNLLDVELEEVLGTFRRGRQMRLSLRWDFFN